MEQIDLTIAKQMVDRYQSTRKELIDSTYSLNDTQSIWVDIAALKDYVAKLPTETTGVRVHFGVYDDAEPIAPGQTTAIFIGTVKGTLGNEDALGTGNAAHDGLWPVNKTDPCPPYCV